MRTPEEEHRRDVEQLRQLALGHYVVAALTALFGSMFLIHVAMGIFVLDVDWSKAQGSPPPPWFGWIFIALGGVFVLAFWTAALLMFLAGRNLGVQRRHRFCFVVAIIACVFPPLGTALGVLSILVLQRESVKRLFDEPATSAARPA